MKHRNIVSVGWLVCGVLAMSTAVWAQTVEWDGGVGGTGTNWGVPANWVGDTLPTTNETARFGDTGTSGGRTITLGTNRQVVGIDIRTDNAVVLGDSSDVTATNVLTLQNLLRTNITAAVEHELASDLALNGACAWVNASTQGLLELTGKIADGPSTGSLELSGPGVVYFNCATLYCFTNASFSGGTTVRDGSTLRIYNTGEFNPQQFYFGTGTITLTNATLDLRDLGGSNGGIKNDLVINGTGTVASSHTHVESGVGRSFNLHGNTYLNGILVLTGGQSLNEGTNGYTLVGVNKWIYINQDGAGVRRIVQRATAIAPERAWTLGYTRDSAGSAGNELQLQNLSEAGTRFYLMGYASDNQGGMRILDDGVPEDLLTFSNAVESTAYLTSIAGRLGRCPVVVDPGALLVLRYNRGSEGNDFTYYGIYPDEPLTANGTVFIGKRRTKFGTTNDYVLATMGSLSGTGRVVLCHAQLSVGNDDADSSFGGTLEDDPYIDMTGITNSLVKLGSGVFTLSGSACHSGGTTVSAGTLRVAGRLEHANLTVQTNALLDGSGTIRCTITNDTVEAMDIDGTLDITGLTLEVEFEGTQTATVYSFADFSDGAVVGTAFADVQTSKGSWRVVVGGSAHPGVIALHRYYKGTVGQIR